MTASHKTAAACWVSLSAVWACFSICTASAWHVVFLCAPPVMVKWRAYALCWWSRALCRVRSAVVCLFYSGRCAVHGTCVVCYSSIPHPPLCSQCPVTSWVPALRHLPMLPCIPTSSEACQGCPVYPIRPATVPSCFTHVLAWCHVPLPLGLARPLPCTSVPVGASATMTASCEPVFERCVCAFCFI